MTPVALRDFLLNASLGPIKPGLNLEDVTIACGQPDEVSSRKPRIWRYGSLQIAFERTAEHLSFIGLYFRETPFVLPRVLTPVGWWPTIGTSLSLFEDFADGEKIVVREYAPLSFDDQITLITESGVTIAFMADENNQMTIDSLQYIERTALPVANS